MKQVCVIFLTYTLFTQIISQTIAQSLFVVFLPSIAMLVQHMLSCVCVCLSVSHTQYCIKVAKLRFTQTIPQTIAQSLEIFVANISA